MFNEYIFVAICLVIFGGNKNAKSFLVPEHRPAPCLQNNLECEFSWECCSGCCIDGRCDMISETCALDKHPCESHDCPEGMSCQLETLLCIRAPCPLQPVCREYVNQCAQNFTCDPGFHCEIKLPPILPKYCPNPNFCTPKPACVKDRSSCDGITCPYGSSCVVSFGYQPECVPSCDQFDCVPGFQCRLQKFECDRGLCDQRPICFPSCAGAECPPGKVCRVKKIPCSLKSGKCPERADCFITCENVTCPAGEACNLRTGKCRVPITRPPSLRCF